jgi:spore maturation protein CgeB
MKIVFVGPSATNHRALLRALDARGHEVAFLERESVGELRERFGELIADADLAVVGSYIPDGVAVAELVLECARGVTVFYDIDTPVTLAKLERGDTEYLAPELVPRFDLYLSSTGGQTLQVLEERWAARFAYAFYCFVDPDAYDVVQAERRWDLGYLGTYSGDRQPQVDELLIAPAQRAPEFRFVVAGAHYPDTIECPPNVERRDHVPPADQPAFCGSQRFTLNVTRADMRWLGWSPGMRLFEAAACGVPVISDWWPGIDDIFTPGEEILLAESADDVLIFLDHCGDDEAAAIGERARRRVLAEHTAERRVQQLEALTGVSARAG